MRKVLIVFPYIHLAYSPSTLNLFYELKKIYDVELLALEPYETYSSQKLTDEGIKYFKVNDNFGNSLASRVYKKIRFRLSSPAEQLRAGLLDQKCKMLIDYISRFEGEIIAVDFMALWCSQQTNKNAHLLSLEIFENDGYRSSCDLSRIKSVIIQSEERYNYLFTTFKPTYFIVQNAPPNVQFEPEILQRKPNQLIFCGSAMSGFGIYSCLDFLMDFPEYVLTLQGAMPKVTMDAINNYYSELIAEERLVIDSKYLSATELTYYVSEFRIGFVFYDFYRFESYRTFNYFTAPSGKLFQYLNSGVPVVANQLPAFKIIEEKKIGKLIPYLSSLAIKNAIDSIESSYYETALNAKKVSASFNFSDSIQHFLHFLELDMKNGETG